MAATPPAMTDVNGAGVYGNGVTTGASIKSGISLDERERFGDWLCTRGSDYQRYIASLSGSNPGLRQPDPANKDHPLTANNAVVWVLESPTDGLPEFKTQSFVRDSAALQRHFEQTKNAPSSRRIYIMEGLAKDYVKVIGGHFFMEPSFFLRQERTCVWSHEFTPTSDALPHPSLLKPGNMFHLQYCELRQFDKIMENRPFFCQRTGRHVGMTPAREKEKSTTGILRRKISFWSRTTSGGGWDVVLLCDPQLAAITANDALDVGDNSPFQGGYVDFLPHPDRERALAKPPHQHLSMLEDLLHYFKNHSDLIEAEKWTEPLTASIFLKKIVAAHYLQLVDYIKAMLPSLELRLTTAWLDEQDQWKSLQTISRRCGNYRDDIEDTLLSLNYPLKDVEVTNVEDWQDCQRDFQYIYFRLKILKQRADTLMQAMTGLASIAGNRQNLEEAKRVKRLNLLALLFIPLAYTSSLFSMQDNYAPNREDFWIYWVSALTVVAFTLIITWVLDSALDEAAQWTLKPLRWFKFWNRNERASFTRKKKRSKTGLFSIT